MNFSFLRAPPQSEGSSLWIVRRGPGVVAWALIVLVARSAEPSREHGPGEPLRGETVGGAQGGHPQAQERPPTPGPQQCHRRGRGSRAEELYQTVRQFWKTKTKQLEPIHTFNFLWQLGSRRTVASASYTFKEWFKNKLS